MKTPIVQQTQNFSGDAENLRSQYFNKDIQNPIENTELKKNVMLTPFLLAIPVIIILFILISGTANDTSIISTEPIQHELVNTERSEKLNVAVMKADSSLSLKTIALPAKK